MASSITKRYCIKCEKPRATLKCAGCSRDLCYDHLNEHRQELNKEFDQIEMNTDLFRDTFNQLIHHPKEHLVIEQINKWELNSIELIQQKANQSRQVILQYNNQHFNEIQFNLNQLTSQLRENRQENNFNEIDLNQFKRKLKQLDKQLQQSPNLSIQHDSTSLINNISIIKSSQELFSSLNTKWIEDGISIVGGHGKGSELYKLYYPKSISIDNDEQIISIADYENHRIIQWNSQTNNSQILAPANEIDQLKWPTDVIYDKINNSILICDTGNQRVIRWSLTNNSYQQTIISNINSSRLTMDNNQNIYVSDLENNQITKWRQGDKNGTIMAGGNGKGNELNQLNEPSGIFVDDNYSIYISDTWNNRVIKWIKDAKEGIIVAGGNGEGNCLTQLSHPTGIVVNQLSHIYVCDSWNNRIMCWEKDAKQGSLVLGGNGEGNQSNQFNYPVDLSFDQQGNIYVVDCYNHRIQKFNIQTN